MDDIMETYQEAKEKLKEERKFERLLWEVTVGLNSREAGEVLLSLLAKYHTRLRAKNREREEEVSVLKENLNLELSK